MSTSSWEKFPRSINWFPKANGMKRNMTTRKTQLVSTPVPSGLHNNNKLINHSNSKWSHMKPEERITHISCFSFLFKSLPTKFALMSICFKLGIIFKLIKYPIRDKAKLMAITNHISGHVTNANAQYINNKSDNSPAPPHQKFVRG